MCSEKCYNICNIIVVILASLLAFIGAVCLGWGGHSINNVPAKYVFYGGPAVTENSGFFTAHLSTWPDSSNPGFNKTSMSAAIDYQTGKSECIVNNPPDKCKIDGSTSVNYASFYVTGVTRHAVLKGISWDTTQDFSSILSAAPWLSCSSAYTFFGKNDTQLAIPENQQDTSSYKAPFYVPGYFPDDSDYTKDVRDYSLWQCQAKKTGMSFFVVFTGILGLCIIPTMLVTMCKKDHASLISAAMLCSVVLALNIGSLYMIINMSEANLADMWYCKGVSEEFYYADKAPSNTFYTNYGNLAAMRLESDAPYHLKYWGTPKVCYQDINGENPDMLIGFLALASGVGLAGAVLNLIAVFAFMGIVATTFHLRWVKDAKAVAKTAEQVAQGAHYPGKNGV